MSRQIWMSFWSKNDSNYLDVNLNIFSRDKNRDFCLVQNLKKGESNFNQLMRLRNQLVLAAENFGREENLSIVLTPTRSKYMDEQLKPAHKVIVVVDRANRAICETLLRLNVEKPESSYAPVRKIAKKKEDEKFQQTVYVE